MPFLLWWEFGFGPDQFFWGFWIEEQGKLEVASRSRQKCGAIFTYANLRQLCTSNPVSNLKGALASPKKNKFNSLPPKDLPQFLVKLDEYDGAIITKLALRFVLLTFARTIELHLGIDRLRFFFGIWIRRFQHQTL
jgi:integrase